MSPELLRSPDQTNVRSETIHSERVIVSRVELFRHAEHINVCWNRPDAIVLVV
jgi:hypothetical protein